MSADQVRKTGADLEEEWHRLARWAREKPVVPTWLWNRLRELRNDFEAAVRADVEAALLDLHESVAEFGPGGTHPSELDLETMVRDSRKWLDARAALVPPGPGETP